jgi:hypothetical protein
MHMPVRAAIVAAAFFTPGFAQTPGAAYPTAKTGDPVHGNQFAQDVDVYLAGGPGPLASCAAPGLPDGHYYFQVTDPTGAMLLSTDTIGEREVVVTGGVIAQHVTGSHVVFDGPCGSKVVQLMPFAATPFVGNEYTVWLTPVGAYDPQLTGFHGFQSPSSRTDNFKVDRTAPLQSVITGSAFFDHNEDGVWNPGIDAAELPIPGWRVEILRNGVLDGVSYTDATGRYVFLRDRDDSSWTIREIAPGGFVGDGVSGAIWVAKTPRSAVVVTNDDNVDGPAFGNISFEVKPGLGRSKGFWHNQNGRAILAQHDPQWRTALTTRADYTLNLRRPIVSTDPAVSIFRPLPPPATFDAAHADFAEWIVSDPTLGHAGFILSSQLAASILNHDFGFMQFTIYVDVHHDGLLQSFEELVEHAAGLLSSPTVGLTVPGGGVDEEREHIFYCINEFSGINNSGDLAQPQVVFGPTPRPKAFASPYVL